MIAFDAGNETAHWIGSWNDCRCAWMARGESTSTSGASTPLLFEPAGLLAAGGKNRSPEEPADHALGRSRGGFGTKLHLVTDGQGVPLQVLASAGQRHESLFAEPVLSATQVRCANGRSRRRPQRVAGDKGYSYPRIRQYLRRRRIKAVIPTRSNQPAHPAFDRETYRRRNVVERCVGWLKENRRLGTRHEKLAITFTAMAKWAIVRRYFRLLDSSDRT